MSNNVAVRVKYGNCRCVELPIGNEGIIPALLRVHHPEAVFVDKCPHWEVGSISPLKPKEQNDARSY